MRFISKYAGYMLHVQPQIVEAYATGQTKVVQPQIIARFEVSKVTGDERALARQMFQFNGFAQEQDLVTVVEPDARISAFDSRLAQAENGWTDEQREMVEQALVAEWGRLPQDMIKVEEVRLAPPWPTYDSFSGTRAELLEKLDEDGYNVADVLAYERDAQNRAEVVAVLERALEDEPDTTPVGEEELVG